METDLAFLLDTLPGFAWTALPDGRAEYIGEQWLDYTGLTFEQAIGAGWIDAVHTDDTARLLSIWNAIVASGELGEAEARLRRRDGVYRWFLFRACPMHGPSGEILRWSGINFDIDDRVRAEVDAQRHKHRFERILDGLPLIAGLHDPAGRITFCNRHMLDFLGRTFEEVQTGPWIFEQHPDSRDENRASWRTAIENGQVYDREARLLRSDGVYRWHRMITFPLLDEAGEIDLWYGVSTDIDEARQAQAMLAAEKRLLEQVAKGVALPPVLDELARVVEALSPGCHCAILMIDEGREHFRLGAAPTVPDGYKAILDGKEIDPRAGPSSRCIIEKAPVIVGDAAGDPRWTGTAWPTRMKAHGLHSCWTAPVLGSDGAALAAFAIYRCEPQIPTAEELELIDRFTHIAGIAIERAQADAALFTSQAELLQAYAHLNEAQQLSRTGSYTIGLRGGHVWSDELRRICEVDPGIRVDMDTLRAVIHPEDLAVFDAAVAASTSGVDPDVKFRIVTIRGGVKHLHAVAHRVTQPDGRSLFHGAVHDVTEATMAEAALGRARAELAHVSRVSTMGALTASIAHEVNQPLAGIITNASTCLRMLAADPPNLEGAQATAQRTIRDGNRASDVIQRLRGLFARKEPSLERLDLNDAAREVLALSASELQRRRVIVRTAFGENPADVLGDRIQLQQVILNLVLNAADAMGAVDDRPRDLVLATAALSGGQVQLSVRDSGAGFGGKPVEELFQAFHTTKPDGMGIGLSISRSIVEAHRGELWGAPNDGPGATFAFSIPCDPAVEPAPRRIRVVSR